MALNKLDLEMVYLQWTASGSDTIRKYIKAEKRIGK